MTSIKFSVSGSQILGPEDIPDGSLSWDTIFGQDKSPESANPSYSFAVDSDCGIFFATPRKPGEVRRNPCECQTLDGRWVSIDHVEDDNGFHWEYEGKSYPSDGYGGDSYIYGGLPWEVKEKERRETICQLLLKKLGLK